MGSNRSSSGRRLLLAVVAVAIALGAFVPTATATSFSWINGFDEPATPDQYDKVGILKEGSPSAEKILILVPGTSASAAYMDPLAKLIVSRARGWQVWAIERRENLIEDQSVVDQAKGGEASAQRLFDYYLGWLANPNITDHFKLVPDLDVLFAREWGMKVAVEDLRQVVKLAHRQADEVVLGGHSLGGSITTAYATWDFNGRPGAADLDGLVYIDGGSGPATLTAEQATTARQGLGNSSPWLSFGGIAPPFAGLFNVVGSTLAKIAPDSPSILQDFPFIPANLRAPLRVTNEAAYGHSLDTETSPPNLAAAQVHAGHLAASGDPRGWDDAAELSPIRRVADAFSGTGLPGLDGTAWYHPLRLTIDAGAVNAGIANPAQGVLDVESTHGADVPRIPIYAFGAALGGQRVLDAAQLLATQSGIPSRKVTLVNDSAIYAHVDPIAAYPQNDFVTNLLPFFKQVKERGHGDRDRRHRAHRRGRQLPHHHRHGHHGRDHGKDHGKDQGKGRRR
jgi:Alpha/beta hydrolase family